MAECMTQEDAMNMSNEQAIQILTPLRDMMRDQHGCPVSDAYFAIDKAISVLKQNAGRSTDAGWFTNDRMVCGYTVKGLVLFAEACRREGVTEEELRDFVHNAAAAVRLVLDEQQKIVSDALKTYKINDQEKSHED